MRSSIGFGAYDQFGYASEPQWGMFNPPQSLFKGDPTLYNSLFATNENLDETTDVERAKRRAKQHPGLPYQVGPRNAWKRNIARKEVGSHNRLGDYTLGDGAFKTYAPIVLLLSAVIGFVLWKQGILSF